MINGFYKTVDTLEFKAFNNQLENKRKGGADA
jgi:hypothetical protein